MKKRFYICIALLLCACFATTSASALVTDGRDGGVVRRGYYYNGQVSFQLPSTAWVQDSAVAYNDSDEIILKGAADVNGFIPSLMILISDSPWNTDAEFEELETSGESIRVANQNYTINGMDVHYDCYLSCDESGRMGLDYLLFFNYGDYSVTLYYYTFASTRSIPDELPKLDEMAASFEIAQPVSGGTT